MYRVPFERFDGSIGDWVFWSVIYETDQDFLDNYARSEEYRAIYQALYEEYEGALDFDELERITVEEMSKISDEELLDRYSCWKVS